jgi:hypothetical protein
MISIVGRQLVVVEAKKRFERISKSQTRNAQDGEKDRSLNGNSLL